MAYLDLWVYGEITWVLVMGTRKVPLMSPQTVAAMALQGRAVYVAIVFVW